MEEILWIGCEDRKRLGVEACSQVSRAKKYNQARGVYANAACSRNPPAIGEADLLEPAQRIDAAAQDQRGERRANMPAEGPRRLPGGDGICAVRVNMDRNACARFRYSKSFRLNRKERELTINGKKAQKICRENAQQHKSDEPSPGLSPEETLHRNTTGPYGVLYPRNLPICKDTLPPGRRRAQAPYCAKRCNLVSRVRQGVILCKLPLTNVCFTKITQDSG